MRESTPRERPRRPYQGLTHEESEADRKHRAVDERAAAVRRWIDDEDDDACRGID